MDKEKFIEIFEENRLVFLHGNMDGILWLLKELDEDERELLMFTGEDIEGTKHLLGLWIKRSERLRKILEKYWNCPFIQLTEIFIGHHDTSKDDSGNTPNCNFDIFTVKYAEETVRKQAEYIWENDIKRYCEENNIIIE